MSFAKQLLYSIADQLGKQRKDMDSFILLLEKNWFDTKEALKSMTQKDFDKLNFPARLSDLIMERLGLKPKNFSNSFKSQKMEEERNLATYISDMNRYLSKSDFEESVRLLVKIYSNIRDNVTEQKYRLLKKSNDKIAKLTSIKQVDQILIWGGFQRTKQGYLLSKINLSLLDECISELSKNLSRGPSANFNPYQQNIISLTKNQDKIYQSESTSVEYNDLLSQQKRKREQIMSRPIKNRQIKIFQIKPQKFENMEIQFNQKYQENQDQRLYKETLKEKMKNFGKQADFMNKRKQEYIELIKQPVYTETIVRVKLPHNWIFQCKFSPLETLQTLVDIFHQYKNLDYYLYMTPPVQKLKGLILRQTFYDLGCIPRSIFYFKCEENIEGNIMKVKKSGFFGLFG